MSVLDDTVPADGDGVTTGVKVSELAGHIRTLKTDINDNFATIDFVNASLAAATLNLFFTDTASSEVSGYYEMLFTETGASSSTLTKNSVSDGDLLWSFISPQFEDADQLIAGLYVASIWSEQDSNKTVTLTAKLYKRDSGGTETLLLETSTSDEIPKDTKTQIIMSGFLENDEAISSTDRVVIKIYANVSGGGGAPNITIYMEGTDDSRIAVRIPTSVITSKIFDADGDTYVEVTDDDVIHFYTAGSERATIDSNGLIQYKNHTFVRVYLNSNQSINNATLTRVNFNSVDNDKLNEYNTTNYKWTATYAGYYHIIAQAEFYVTADGDELLVLARVNGTTNRYHCYQNAGGTGFHTLQINSIIYFDAGDYLEIMVRNNTNNDVITGSNEKRTFLQIYKLPL